MVGASHNRGTMAWVSAAGAVLFSLSASAPGAIIAQYTFPAANAAESGTGYQATTVLANYSATSIADGGANTTQVISSPGTPTYASAPVLQINPNATTAALAVTNGSYFEFTVSSLSPITDPVSLTSLTFDTARGGGGTPRGWAVRTNVDNYAADVATADTATVRNTFSNISIPLSAAQYQNLSTITFRIYSYSPGTGSSLEYDNITVNGVPEPASLGLAACGGILLLSRRRRPA